MNSSYGKFAERFDDRPQQIHESHLTKEDFKNGSYDRIGNTNYFSYKEQQDPKSHCIPIWSIYVSSYGRIKTTKWAKRHNAIYCDTDSIITKDILPTSTELGAMKLEMHIKEGIIVRPKFYATVNDDNEEDVKIKGLAMRLTFQDLKDLPNDPVKHFNHFTTFKESLRRGLIPNEIIDAHKEFSLEDDKRDWLGEKFSMTELQDSEPLYIDENLMASKKPTINNGVNSIGEVAPTTKYDIINITLPSTPSMEDS
jgi:hypothetical protein